MPLAVLPRVLLSLVCLRASRVLTPATATDNCDLSLSTTNPHNSGDLFGLGMTTVTYTFTDDAGNTATCSFTVTVTDNTFPVISGCPSDIALTTNQSGLNFKGVKIGDVVSTWANPANFGKGEPLVWQVQDRVLQAGETVEAEFRADQLDDLTAFQFALHFDPARLRLDSVESLGGLPALGPDNFGTYNLAGGEIRVVWAGDKALALGEATPVFRLRFTALQGGQRLTRCLNWMPPKTRSCPRGCTTARWRSRGCSCGLARRRQRRLNRSPGYCCCKTGRIPSAM